jgi:hypothetical protein
MSDTEKREYRFVGRNGFKTRWRKFEGSVPHPKASTRARLGEHYDVQLRTKKKAQQ